MLNRKSLSIIGVISVVGLVLWWWLSRPSEASRPPEIEQPLAQMQAIAKLPPAERAAKFRAVREQVSQLSPEAQKAFRRASGEMMRAQMENRLNAFFEAKTPAQKNQILDRDIREMEQRLAMRSNTPPRNPGPQQTGARSGGFGRRGGTLVRLDRSTPEERARRGEYFKALSERRRQLGLPPISRGGRGGR